MIQFVFISLFLDLQSLLQFLSQKITLQFHANGLYVYVSVLFPQMATFTIDYTKGGTTHFLLTLEKYGIHQFIIFKTLASIPS